MIEPKTEPELASAIAAADGPLAIEGGGTRGIAATGNVLTTRAISGVTLYEPGALTLVAKAGTPLAEIDRTLEAEGQRLAFEPMDHRGLLGTGGEPTIGGVVASNISGPRRIQAGACRDFLLGVQFVDGSGAVLKNGGRVMKNVTGYDLVKLMAGSFGTLGVLTEVSLKVMPKPETAATLVIHGLSDGDAQRAMTAALTSPYDVTGAAHMAGRTLVRVEGFAGSVAYRAEQLQGILGAFGEVSVEADVGAVAQIWRDVRDVATFHGRAGDVWRISCKPSDGPALAAKLGAEVLYDWGGGLVWALVAEGTDVRAALGAFDGHARLERGAPATLAAQPRFQPQPAAVAALSAGLRQRFDPRGILNAGLMG